jgi:hypothetical protein
MEIAEKKRSCRMRQLASRLEGVPQDESSILPMFVPKSDKSSDMVFNNFSVTANQGFLPLVVAESTKTSALDYVHGRLLASGRND